jgi:beta-glucanase (GH16 family)
MDAHQLIMQCSRNLSIGYSRKESKSLLIVVLVAILIAGCQLEEQADSINAIQNTQSALAIPGEPTEVSTETSIPTSTPIPAPVQIPILVEDGWELVWQDDFDGDQLNRSNWTFDIGGWGWGNGEAQYYTDRPENVRVENGLLVIEARQEKHKEKYYTSARLLTQGLQSFQYGRIESRIKVPPGAGFWPAFWMLGSDFQRDPGNPHDSNWPDVGEIDVMEYVGREPDLTIGTVHGPGYSGALGLGGWNRQEFAIADDFHTYAIEWDYDGISWFFDGDKFFHLEREAVGDREWVFDQEFFILLNLAVGGQLAGPIGLDTKFPSNVYVDYVRVYQKQ